MKQFIHITILICIFIFQANATIYYSTQDGDWANPIWSTVDHSDLTSLTALPCQFTGNDSVYIAHNIESNCGLLEIGHLGGSSVIQLSPSGSFTVNGILDIFGGFVIAIVPGTEVIVNGDLNMHGNSEIIVDGTLTVNGDVEMWGNTRVCGSGNATYTGSLTIHGNNAEWCSTLPIELVDFQVTASNLSIELNWTTASELNNDFFSVERSLDGQNYELIETIAGAGNSSELLAYNYTDLEDLSNYEWVYYRVKQTDYDGSFAYTHIVAVSPVKTKRQTDILIYPNPAVHQFNIQLNHSVDNGQARVFNALGQLITQQPINSSQIIFNVENWDAGCYFVIINIDDQQLQQQVIVE